MPTVWPTSSLAWGRWGLGNHGERRNLRRRSDARAFPEFGMDVGLAGARGRPRWLARVLGCRPHRADAWTRYLRAGASSLDAAFSRSISRSACSWSPVFAARWSAVSAPALSSSRSRTTARFGPGPAVVSQLDGAGKRARRRGHLPALVLEAAKRGPHLRDLGATVGERREIGQGLVAPAGLEQHEGEPDPDVGVSGRSFSAVSQVCTASSVFPSLSSAMPARGARRTSADTGR